MSDSPAAASVPPAPVQSAPSPPPPVTPPSSSPPSSSSPSQRHRQTPSTVRRLLGYLWPYRGVLLLGLVFAGIYAAAAQGRVLLLKPTFDNVFTTPVVPDAGALSTDQAAARAAAIQMESLGWVVLALVAITFVQGPAGFLRQYLGERVTQRVFVDVQRQIQQHLLRLDMSFFVRHRHGDLLSRMSADIERMLVGVGFTAGDLVVQCMLLGFGLAVAVYASWQLTVVCVVVIPVLIVVLGFLSKKVRHWSRKAHESRGEVLNTLAQGIAGIRLVKSFRRENQEVGRFHRVTADWLRHAMTAVRFKTINYSGIDFLYNLLLAGLIFLGGWMVVNSETTGLTGGWFLVFIAALVSAYDPIRRLTRAINMYQDCFAASDRVFEILDMHPTIVDPPTAVDLPGFSRQITFDGVSFSYAQAIQIAAPPSTYDRTDRDGAPISTPPPAGGEVVSLDGFRLDGVSFTAKKGEIIALVGERGSGKSTILDLLLRLYDPQAGRILIDGIDLKNIRRESLASMFAVVTQDTFLFHDTIAANIAFGRPDATPEKIREAAAQANILDFIERQPNGLDTVVGDRGSRLSGGERQSLSIARAILTDAPILLFDEATSNLDAVSEKRIQEAMDRVMTERTVFVVAHRLSTVRHAHQILVMSRGQIIETGTHAELLAQNGHYAHLHATQFST